MGAAGSGSADRPDIRVLRGNRVYEGCERVFAGGKDEVLLIFSKPYPRTFLKSVKFIPVVFLKNLLKCAESEKPR